MNRIKAFLRRTKRLTKSFFFWLLISNPIVRLSRIPLVTTLVPAVTGGYLALKELYGEKWAFFTKLESTHDLITLVLISATIFVALLRGVADSWLKRHEGGYIDLLHNFIHMTTKIVSIKSTRFKDVARSITENDDVFLLITHPKDQIKAILNEAAHFIRQSFNIDSEDDLRITILTQLCGSREWDYAFDTHDNWSQTSPNNLMRGPSAARDCLDTGEPRFHPDKLLAASEGCYLLSDRDKRGENGSVYCYPVSIEANGYGRKGIITFTTYNTKLCGNYNKREIKRIATLLREVCRRLELELTLKSIKDWKYNSLTRRGVENG